jgi:hypothetical protein
VGHADAADGAGVNDAFDAGALGGGEEMASAFDIGGVKIGRVLGPEAVIGGDMKDAAATGDGAGEGIRIAEIARNLFDREFAKLAGRPAKSAHAMTLLGEEAGDVPT